MRPATSAQVKAAVLDGWNSVDRLPIRTWEFFNYATWDYTPAAEPGQLSLDVQLAEGDEPGAYTLQVGLASEKVENSERDPVNLTFE